MIALLSSSPPSTVSETLALIEASTASLKASVANPIALSAGTDLFQRYIISTLQSGSSPTSGKTKLAISNGGVDDFGATRAHLLANSKVFVQRAKEARGSIARIAKNFVQDGCIVLTCGYSRVVAATLHAAVKDNAIFRVIYAQSVSPGPEEAAHVLGLIAGLRREKILVATVPFAALATAVSQASFCMVGAESVVENGGVISSMGTRQLALLAQNMGKPFYVMVESHKFVRLYPLEAEELGLENDVLDFQGEEGSKDRTKVLQQEDDAKEAVSNALDLTPPELITSLITESGVRTPSAVSEELIKIWY